MTRVPQITIVVSSWFLLVIRKQPFGDTEPTLSNRMNSVVCSTPVEPGQQKEANDPDTLCGDMQRHHSGRARQRPLDPAIAGKSQSWSCRQRRSQHSVPGKQGDVLPGRWTRVEIFALSQRRRVDASRIHVRKTPAFQPAFFVVEIEPPTCRPDRHSARSLPRSGTVSPGVPLPAAGAPDPALRRGRTSGNQPDDLRSRRAASIASA